MEEAHSAIGPSGAERWMNCPGSVLLGKQAKAQKTNEAAAEGTVAHSLGEALTDGKTDETTLMGRVGEIVEQEGHEIEITEEMVLAVIEYAGNIGRDLAALTADNRPAPVMQHTEMDVHLASIDEDLWGKADKIIYRKGHKLIVRDFKFGRKGVSPEKNKQGALYLLGAMETIAGEAYDELEIVIDQPRAGGEKRWAVDKEWLKQFKEDVRKAVALTRMPNAPLKAGDWCKWCRAGDAGICPEINTAAQRETEADFNAVVPSTPRAGLPDPQSLSPEKIARVLDWSDPIEAWLGSMWILAQEKLERGEVVPGYKLVEGRATRKWADGTGEDAARRFEPEYQDRVYGKRKPLSVAQMEKLVGAKNLPTQLVVKPAAPNKIVKDSDPREAVRASAETDFGAAAPALPAPVTQMVAFVDPLFAAPVTSECCGLFGAPELVSASKLQEHLEAPIVAEPPKKRIWP